MTQFGMPPANLAVSQHAIDQFIVRAKPAKTDPDVIKDRIIHNVMTGQEIRKKDNTMNLLNHGAKEARYFHNRAFVYVIVDNIVATCYSGPMRSFTGYKGESKPNARR